MNPERWAPRLVMGSVLLGSALASVRAPAAETSQPPRVPQALQERAQREGSARVIVELRLGSGKGAPEGLLPGTQAVRSQRSEIAAVQDRVLTRLAGRSHRLHHRFGAVPFVALDVDAAALAALEADPEVERVVEDRLVAPVLAQSVPLVQGDVAWDFGYDGTGQVVAIVDSGVDGAHPFLAGKVVEEACYASGNGCPNGLSTQFGVGAAVPCPFDPDSCLHGTHVAGIAAGSGTSFSGVARGAHLMAIQVFHPSTTDCTILENVPCARAFSSDIGAGLEHVYDLRTQYTIAAANLSLGGGSFTSTCDNQEPQLTAQIANLRSVGIATVIASGNDGKTRSLAFPACISSAVSVASTDKSDQVSWFSDVASFLSLFAPGEQINSSVPGGGFEVLDGTSMAAPHVAGAWAILRQANPTASVSTLLQTLQLKGLPITDTRGNKPITKSRIRILDALGLSLPLPVLNSISPLAVSAWGPDFSLTVNGTGFFHSSVVRVNGAARATTYINATTLTALVSASDIASTSAGLTIGVFNPAPGGGASGTTTLALRQPVLTVNTASVSAGGQVTATLTNAPGGVADWLALAAVGAANTSYLQWTYVGGGVNTRTWTVVLPSVGNYEFRLFINNGYTRVATSPPVAAVPGPPAALAVSATSAAAGSAVTVTLANGAGGAQDWLSLAAVGSPDTSILQWTYVGAGVTTRTWTVTLPTPGSYEFRLFLDNGYTRAATSPAVAVQYAASLTVSTTSIPSGGQVTVTLAGGPGGPQDWLSVAPVGSPDTSYLQWTYIGAGVTTRTWTVTLTTPGSYEFRAFANGVATHIAVSPAVDVQSTVALSVSATSVPIGGQVTVTLTGGQGGSQDWLALAAVGSPDASYLQWTYVGTGVTTRTWTLTLSTAGSYEFRLFLTGGGARAATSPAVTVAATPNLAVSATSVAVGGQVTVTLTNGAGGAQDWLALAEVGSPASSYLQSTIVGAGLTTRTWTVTLAAAGSYEFRLFVGGGTTPAATSPAVSAASVPLLAVSATSVAAGAQVTLTLTNGRGGTADWLALAAAGAPDTSFLDWTYVGAGVTTRTWTVTLPTPGTYEFRLFLDNGYTRAATSPAVSVQYAAALAVSATSVPAGGQVTVTLTGGGGGAQDWLGLAEVGSPDSSYLQWTYVGAGVTTRTWTVSLPAPGNYEFRYFPGGSSVRAATSPAVTAQYAATLTVSDTSVPAGSPVTVTLADGPGGPWTWLALAPTGSPDSAYVQWTYVGWQVTAKTWTVALPSAGSYEFRLFLDNGFTRIATSPTVTATP